MKFTQGWQFPDDETHLPDVIARQSRAVGIEGYQVRSRNRSLFGLAADRRVFADEAHRVGESFLPTLLEVGGVGISDKESCFSFDV